MLIEKNIIPTDIQNELQCKKPDKLLVVVPFKYEGYIDRKTDHYGSPGSSKHPSRRSPRRLI
jgi:hypothetical protein